MFNKILVANRGEIACRIIKSAHKMGIEVIAVYSDADRHSLHTIKADGAICLGAPDLRASYLNVDKIIAAAIASGAEAIHPGYGFLSENPCLAQACKLANIVFVGPAVAAMELMASKQLAKQRLANCLVPLIPGYHGTDQSDLRLLDEAKELGFPILIKAANGGGGKGMRTAVDENSFLKELDSARRESLANFADDTMILEKLIQHPRHVEIQIMADNHANIVHLYERDCSIQRRHQKIIEEAPALQLSADTRQNLADTAIMVAREINYSGAGTVEFLVDYAQNFYFMEMNTRLQVEHPVTELITGLDLVEWQLRIAANEHLPCTQAQIKSHGHAIECRIYAEDPERDFIPSAGNLHFLQEPSGEGIRIDSGVALNSTIGMHYDPMLAKLIAYGDTRAQAIQRLELALAHYYIGGVKTNIAFLQAIIAHKNFLNTIPSTDFLNDTLIEPKAPDTRLALMMAACLDYIYLFTAKKDGLTIATFAWQMHLKTKWSLRYLVYGNIYAISLIPIDQQQLILKFNQDSVHLHLSLTKDLLRIDDGYNSWSAQVEVCNDKFIFYTKVGQLVVNKFKWEQCVTNQINTNDKLSAPMPGTIVAILKNKGDTIKAGERLIVLEAMKMEHAICAPYDGVLTEIFYNIGAQVSEGVVLVAIN